MEQVLDFLNLLPTSEEPLKLLTPTALSSNDTFEALEIGDETTDIIGVIVKIFLVIVKKSINSAVHFEQ